MMNKIDNDNGKNWLNKNEDEMIHVYEKDDNRSFTVFSPLKVTKININVNKNKEVVNELKLKLERKKIKI